MSKIASTPAARWRRLLLVGFPCLMRSLLSAEGDESADGEAASIAAPSSAKGPSASAASRGVWNRRSGFLAISLPTRRTSFGSRSGRRSVSLGGGFSAWALSFSIRPRPANGAWPVSRK